MRHDPDESEEDAYEEDSREDEESRARNTVKFDEGPACQSCRRKKAKCSRGQPCTQCVRYNFDCFYDGKKAKPGMRTGAIENLNQRVATLENMFLGQGLLWQQVWRCLESIGSPNLPLTSEPGTGKTLDECTSQLKKSLSTLQPPGTKESENGLTRPPKRRKTHSSEGLHVPPNGSELPFTLNDGMPLPDDLVDSLVEIYFARIQPWIPILHVRQFREKMRIPSKRQKLKTIFSAIISLCLRFSDDPRLGDPAARTRLAKQSRQAVILESMESFSVENLQALIICAFDTIGSGRGPSSWSIVGSMARTVDHLQLSLEVEDIQQTSRESEVLITRIAFLPPCQDWTEVEERRRVFWNVFLMDRFCSIATGWNLSLKSAEVKRRLPCEGALWETGKPLEVPTPYFGVSDQSNPTNGIFFGARPEAEEPDSLGGFAYCIEATESLSLVTSFFLQQVVDITDIQSVQLWLVRFKQLDLRLVQWKVFLPERWREACALNPDGNMDPNLTLAHITHNTAVVLLHQGIAYPSPDWQNSPIRLPSTSSAETCLAAAREVAIISDKFLQDADFLTNPQFSFCLFVCGRMLLAHSAYYGIELPQVFDMLVASLWEVSRRWSGHHASLNTPASRDNLASKFAARLSQARDLGPSTLDIRQAACSENQSQAVPSAIGRSVAVPKTGPLPHGSANQVITHPHSDAGAGMHSEKGIEDSSQLFVAIPGENEASPDSISLAFPPLPMAFQAPSAIHTATHSPNLGPLVHGPDHADMSFEQSVGNFEMLNSYLDYPFLPLQRVSMFSHPATTEPTEMNGQ